jgi:hypothetical protein
MKRLAAFLSLTVALAYTLVEAKGPTTKVVIKNLATGQVATLTDPNVLSHFNVWAGPGTHSGALGQMHEGTQGFIIDWASGSIETRPANLAKYEVQFFVRHHGQGEEQLAYTVLYERGDSAGFVYLPGRSDPQFRMNVASIIRGGQYEGHWFRASADWQQAVRGVLN